VRHLALVVAACSSAPPPRPPPPKPAPPPVDAAVAVVTPDAPLPAADPLAPIPKDDWDVELVDTGYTAFSEHIDLYWREGAVMNVTANIDALQLKRGPRGWVASPATTGTPEVIGHDPAGHVWGVEYQGHVRRDRDDDGDLGFRPDAIAFDPKGVPWVCGHVDEDKTRPVKLAHRTGPKGKPWVVEDVSAHGLCELAFSSDQPVLGIWDDGVALGGRAGKKWDLRDVTKTKSGIAFATAPDGTLAWAYVDGTDLIVAHTGQQPKAIAKVSGVPFHLALAFAPDGHAHVAFATDNRLLYVAEGHDVAFVMDSPALEGFALVVDPSGVPHIAVASADRLLSITPRGSSTKERGWYEQTSVRDGCAPLIEQALAGPPIADRGVEEQLARACTVGSLLADEETACQHDDRNACLLAGASHVGKATVGPTRVELRASVCGKKECYSHEEWWSNEVWRLRVVDPSELRAADQFAHACRQGSKPACMEAVTLSSRDFASYAKTCSDDLPMGCAAAIAYGLAGTAPARADVEPIRAALDAACNKPKPRPEACNALAFIDDYGFGGMKKRDATKAHLRACGAGSSASCMALLLRKSRPAPPKELDAEAMADVLDDACTGHDPDACTALANAYEAGWGVTRDRDRAKELTARSKTSAP
jgi:hypothetical protein